MLSLASARLVTKPDVRLLHYPAFNKKRKLSEREKHENGSQLHVSDVVDADQGQITSDGADPHPYD